MPSERAPGGGCDRGGDFSDFAVANLGWCTNLVLLSVVESIVTLISNQSSGGLAVIRMIRIFRIVRVRSSSTEERSTTACSR